MLQPIAHTPPKLGTRAAKTASVAIARIGIITASVAAHDSLALLVSGCTLPARARQAITAIAAIRRSDITGACWRASSADFLWVTIASRSTADGSVGSELAIFAAVLVAIVADGVVLELACRGIAATVIATSRFTTAVAILAFFDNAVAALLARDGGDALVGGEALCVDAVAAHGSADVADTARGEVGDAFRSGRVHDVLFAGIAGAGAKRAALLSSDCAIRASL